MLIYNVNAMNVINSVFQNEFVTHEKIEKILLC